MERTYIASSQASNPDEYRSRRTETPLSRIDEINLPSIYDTNNGLCIHHMAQPTKE